MAKQLRSLTEAEINENASFFDAEIIPNVYYQIYGFDKVFCYDDEGVNYLFDSENVSKIQIQVVTETTKTYYQVDALELGDETEGAEAAPAGAIMVEAYPEDLTDAKVGDIYCIEVPGQDENPSTYKYNTVTGSFKETTLDINNSDQYEIIRVHFKGNAVDNETVPAGAKKDDVYCVISETLTPASPTDNEPYEYNKYGEIKPNSKIYVTLALSANLKSLYPKATINIDGKDYDLGLDGTIIPFIMSKDHRIQINWIYSELVETFRITCKR